MKADSVYPRSDRLVAVALTGAYLRSQLVALLATALDFAVLVALVEGLHLHYLPATALGALSGGVAAFTGNRHYGFAAAHGRIGRQSRGYALVWLGSILLNCTLVWALTEGAAVPYTCSKVLAAVAVGVGFNFPLHRWYVFR